MLNVKIGFFFYYFLKFMLSRGLQFDIYGWIWKDKVGMLMGVGKNTVKVLY